MTRIMIGFTFHLMLNIHCFPGIESMNRANWVSLFWASGQTIRKPCTHYLFSERSHVGDGFLERLERLDLEDAFPSTDFLGWEEFDGMEFGHGGRGGAVDVDSQTESVRVRRWRSVEPCVVLVGRRRLMDFVAGFALDVFFDVLHVVSFVFVATLA